MEHRICDKRVDEVFCALFSNEQPIFFPQLMHITLKSSGTYSWAMISSYQILIFNIENTFNSDCKLSTGILILFAVCNIIPLEKNHGIYLIILVFQNYFLLWGSISLLFYGSLSFTSNFFSYDSVSRLSFRSWINVGW